MKRLLILSVLVVIALFSLYVYGFLSWTPVTRVIDGDTLVLMSGERVRLLAIDTPETGQPFYQEAKDWLKGKVEGQPVSLESGNEDRDKYGRLLRYVYLGGELVNLELVELGLASVYMLEPGEKYYSLFLEAESQAKAQGLGIWGYPETNFCLGIHWLQSNAEGDDRENLNGEYVTFRNKCLEPLDLTGWFLRDEANSTYTFPAFVLENKTTVTVHSGKGEDNLTDLYWGRGSPVWNNEGDTLRLWNSTGELLLNYTYSY